MLTTATAAGRRRSLAAALWPTARSVPLAVAAGVLVLAAVPVALTLARGGTRLGGAVGFLIVVGAGVAAVAVEDDAAELLAATPVPLAQRRGLRLAVLAAAFGAVGAASILLALGRDPGATADLPRYGLEGLAAAGVALVVASRVADRRVVGAGGVGATAGPLALLVVSALAQRMPSLPSVAGPRHHERWWYVVVVAWALVVLAWRDPAGRRRRPA